MLGVNVDHRYTITGNLVAVVEAGWARGQFERSVWGRRMVDQAEKGDAWKCAVGLKYRF